MHSFVFCRSLLLYNTTDEDILFSYNYNIYNNKYTLYYFFKFIIENKDLIESEKNPIVSDNEDNVFFAEFLRKIDGHFTLSIPLN